MQDHQKGVQAVGTSAKITVKVSCQGETGLYKQEGKQYDIYD